MRELEQRIQMKHTVITHSERTKSNGIVLYQGYREKKFLYLSFYNEKACFFIVITNNAIEINSSYFKFFDWSLICNIRCLHQAQR